MAIVDDARKTAAGLTVERRRTGQPRRGAHARGGRRPRTAPSTSARRCSSSLNAISILGALLIGWVYVRRQITAPVVRITDAAAAFEARATTGRRASTGVRERTDELGDLARTFTPHGRRGRRPGPRSSTGWSPSGRASSTTRTPSSRAPTSAWTPSSPIARDPAVGDAAAAPPRASPLQRQGDDGPGARDGRRLLRLLLRRREPARARHRRRLGQGRAGGVLHGDLAHHPPEQRARRRLGRRLPRRTPTTSSASRTRWSCS